jgi:hypothetical protein
VVLTAGEGAGTRAIGPELGLHCGDRYFGDLSDKLKAEEAQAGMHDRVDREDFDGGGGKEGAFVAPWDQGDGMLD